MSHRWAIGIFGFISLGFVILVIDVFAGRSGATLGQYASPLLMLSVCFLVFCTLVVGGRHMCAYYITSVCLAALSLRSIYVLFLYGKYFLKGHTALSVTYFHLAERGKPFATEQHMSVARQLIVLVMTGLVTLLFLRFTFGRQSRSYFGLPPLSVKSDTAI